jgi:CheY-like chemotaxis protein
MIHGFMRQSGGEIRVYSEVGQGTTMCLYLPRHHGATDELEPAIEKRTAQRSGSGETVLVVDDEPSIRMLVVEVLEELGYLAIEARDGPTALKLLQSVPSVDLLITDLALPGGINGRELAERARALRSELRVLFITGYAENAVISNGQLQPGVQLLHKPFAVQVLANLIKSILSVR